MTVSVNIVDNSSAWVQTQEHNLQNALTAMADSVNITAARLAPVLTGALKSDGRVSKPSRNTREVTYGDARVPYARHRHFENRKNPQTRYYLSQAGERVAKRGLGVYL